MPITIHDQPLPYVSLLPERPASAVEMVVIHCTELPDLATAREYGERVLYESGAGASGHYYIDRDGAIYRYVPGTRVNLGRYPDWYDSGRQTMTEPYTAEQIAALRTLLAQLRQDYPNLHLIAGHEDLDTARLPATDDAGVDVPRKLDPGPLFPWAQVLEGSGLQRVPPPGH
jgi:N-acetylmuramoyl-L-alanine amidase